MQLEVGKIVKGRVTGLTKFGAFVDLGEGVTGLVHISEVSRDFVKEITDILSEGDEVEVKVLRVGEDSKISLSIKAALPAPRPEQVRTAGSGRGENAFEDMMNRFKQNSEEKMSDLKRIDRAKRGTGRRGGR